MRTTAMILFGLALCSAAFGANSAPTRQALAEMGLGEMQILSDDEASHVRGMGFDGINLHDFKKDFYRDVRSIKRDIHHAQKEVKWSIREVRKIFHPKSHGGKRW